MDPLGNTSMPIVAIAIAEVRRLADEPARSAFVQDQTNSYFYAGAAYRF